LPLFFTTQKRRPFRERRFHVSQIKIGQNLFRQVVQSAVYLDTQATAPRRIKRNLRGFN
jgi:hypothetical protein